MEPNQQLTRQQRELQKSTTPSTLESAAILADELQLTALNSKSVPDERLVAEIARVFLNEPGDALRLVFRQWRRQSPFFPTISNIQALLGAHRQELRIAAEIEAQRQERDRVRVARDRGELVDFADIKKRLTEISDGCKMPEIEQRRRAFNRRVQEAPVVPALHLTPEEIAARCAEERKQNQR